VEYDAARQASVVRESLELSFEELPSGPQPAPGKKNPVREDRGK